MNNKNIGRLWIDKSDNTYIMMKNLPASKNNYWLVFINSLTGLNKDNKEFKKIGDNTFIQIEKRKY